MTAPLKFFNSMTGQKEIFKPLSDKQVTLYVCGPTVYNYAHIGNARPVVVFDLLVRLLRHDFGRVLYARNITDIDDKIIAAAEASGDSIHSITEKYTRIYESDMAALGAVLPDIRPQATAYIDRMITMTAHLLAKGHAYVKDGHVLFSVASMPDYGALSGRALDDMIAGARVQVATYKKNAADFILWKPSTATQPGWDSPWGRGRPGWHIECSAMIADCLGQTIDIHGGGQDLIFPHHENEIAQSRCAHGGAALANYWVHNGYVTVDGEKMSKSLGNFVTVHELLEEFPGKGEAIRLCLLSAHYRQPLDFSRDGIRQAQKQLDRWYRLTKDVSAGTVPEAVLAALRDDLNSPQALAELNRLARAAVHDPAAKKALKAAANLFGLLQQPDWFSRADTDEDSRIAALIAERATAKKNRDFARADQIRDQLAEQGIALLDSPTGTSWERR